MRMGSSGPNWVESRSKSGVGFGVDPALDCAQLSSLPEEASVLSEIENPKKGAQAYVGSWAHPEISSESLDPT